MEQKTKIILLTAGLVVLGTAIGVGVYFLLRKDDAPSASKETDAGDSAHSSTNSESGDKQDTETQTNGEIKPIYNAENELSNDFSELKGRMLYPKREWADGWGYANVRTTPEVNTNQGWWDGYDNLITSIKSGTPIGTVLEETSRQINGYAYRWFKVKLQKPVGFWTTYKEGYVRADTVTIKPYTP